MIYTVLQTIGTLLSGLSIFTVFIMYKKESHDLHMKAVKEAIANTRTVLAEQYTFVQTEYIYSYIEEYFTNNYIQTFISDLTRYISINLNQTPDEVKQYATSLAVKMNLFNYIPLNKSSIYSIFKSNNQTITKDIIYNLIDFYDITVLLTLYQQKSTQIYNDIKTSLMTPNINIDIICDVLLENKTHFNNQNLIQQSIIMKYYVLLQDKYTFELKQLKAIYDISELILNNMFELKDSTLYKCSRNKRKYKMQSSLQENLTVIVKNIPETILSTDDKIFCGQITGLISE